MDNEIPTILREMANTAESKTGQYRANYHMTGPILAALFPDGVTPELLEHPAFHLLVLAVVKITRLAATDLTHIDSAHDLGVYAAMIESMIREREGK